MKIYNFRKKKGDSGLPIFDTFDERKNEKTRGNRE